LAPRLGCRRFFPLSFVSLPAAVFVFGAVFGAVFGPEGGGGVHRTADRGFEA
jgi:hypothetical protein